jgi:tetratricopeptide (TPR) repeat protein
MDTAEQIHARALNLLRKGDTGGGITDLKTYLAAEPDDEEAWLELATAYAAVEHWPDAVHAFARAVELDRTVVAARLGYARALVRVGRLDDAAFQLLQATRLDPHDARVLKDLGVVFYEKRLYEKAATWLTKASAAAPADARTHFALGLAQEARRDMAAAVAAYRDAVRIDPSFTDARKTLADALASVGEHEGAITELEAVLALERSNEQVAHNLDVLKRALADMRAHRLLGKTDVELAASALVQEGQLRRRAQPPASAQAVTNRLRYGGPLVELWAHLDAEDTIESLMLVLLDPDRAARTADDTFKVTVIADDGRHEPTNYATAVSLTFLREALGCPMTTAGELYGRLLGGGPLGAPIEWGGARLSLASAPRPDRPTEQRHGILAERLR